MCRRGQGDARSSQTRNYTRITKFRHPVQDNTSYQTLCLVWPRTQRQVMLYCLITIRTGGASDECLVLLGQEANKEKVKEKNLCKRGRSRSLASVEKSEKVFRARVHQVSSKGGGINCLKQCRVLCSVVFLDKRVLVSKYCHYWFFIY
jgi:hypothetical protein